MIFYSSSSLVSSNSSICFWSAEIYCWNCLKRGILFT